MRRADDCHAPRECRLVLHRNAEVAQLDGALRGEQQVTRLDVAVQHLACVQVLEPLECAATRRGHLHLAQRRALCVHDIEERATFAQLGDDPQPIGVPHRGRAAQHVARLAALQQLELALRILLAHAATARLLAHSRGHRQHLGAQS